MHTPIQRVWKGGLFLTAVVIAAVLGYRFMAGYDWIDALWMVVITISTVGYGEKSDLAPSVQAFTLLVILLGMSAAVYTFGGLFQLILEGELEKTLGKRRMTKDIAQLSGHTIVCGYGRMGMNLANQLRSQGRDIVVIDQADHLVEEAIGEGFLALLGDATEESILIEAGLARAATLASTFGNDAESVFITLTARELNPSIQVIARAERSSTQKKLRQAGADKVVMPTVAGARQMGRLITHPSSVHLFEEGASRSFSLEELPVSATSGLVGMSVQETEAHRRHKLLVVAVEKQDGQLLFNPTADTTFTAGDVLMVIGNRDDIQRFRKEFRV